MCLTIRLSSLLRCTGIWLSGSVFLEIILWEWMVSSRFKMCVIFTISRLELLFPVRRIISLIFSGQNGSMIYVQSSASIMDESLSWGFVLAIMLSQALLMGGYKDMSEEERLVPCLSSEQWRAQEIFFSDLSQQVVLFRSRPATPLCSC